ncbi:MAG: sigma-54 dependent transcriptional regulator [Phycisphaerae bacterium]
MEVRLERSMQSVVVLGQVASDMDGLCSRLRQAAAQVAVADDVDDAVRKACALDAQLVLVHEGLGKRRALRAIKEVASESPQTAVVVVSDRPGVDSAVSFVRAGAYDYVPGPLDDGRLEALLEGLDEEFLQSASGEDHYLCPEAPPELAIVGRSEGITNALQTIRRVAHSRCNPVLIMGETGTGKELAARAVHAWRCGEDEPFVAVNCAALTANLLESELFGHVRGAFTGADKDKTGLFELAGEGVILLDEISEMPVALQAKLLRVLQEHSFRKVGGTKDIKFEGTVIASSNRDLPQEVDKGRFRRDLYYRLAVFPITLPPLREPSRRDDVELLAEYFLRTSTIAGEHSIRELTPGAIEKLRAHHWPGNVRELRNVIERGLLLETSDKLTPASLHVGGESKTSSPAAEAKANNPDDFSLETAEREFILRALRETGWQRTRAAALLGITRATLHAKLKRYDIKPPDSGSTSASASSSNRSGETRKLQGVK